MPAVQLTGAIAASLPMPGAASYSASKHAVVGISKARRFEAARYGVRVSALCPGVIRTPILTRGKFGRTELGRVDEVRMLGWMGKWVFGDLCECGVEGLRA
jgi:NAD(P)-dependent dehydrogenase (short-subunit alcohol dehydrogenase family)